jgi:dinuclear metal center YbgI/SA1388 family protein
MDGVKGGNRMTVLIEAGDVTKYLDELAPPSLAMQNDVIGLQVGRLDKPVHKVLLALDASPKVIAAAVQYNADLLITHHALLYHPVKRIDTLTPKGASIAQALRHDLTVYNAHTNLDIVEGGVNDVLADMLGLTDLEILDRMQNERLHNLVDRMGKASGLGRVGQLPNPVSLREFAQMARDLFGLSHIRFGGNPDMIVQRIAVLGGSGGRWAGHAIRAGAQVLLTADCDHHTVADAWDDGLAIVDATHAALEMPVLRMLQNRLQEKFRDNIVFDIVMDIANVQEDPFTWL